MEGLTFSLLITPAGIIVAGGLVTGVVEVLKTQLAGLDARVSGARLAFLSGAVLYAAAALAQAPLTPDAALNVFAAWLACASAAIRIKSATRHVQQVAGR